MARVSAKARAAAAAATRARLLAEAREPLVCYRCLAEVPADEFEGAGTGTDLVWCVSLWLCTACCAALVTASRPPKRSQMPWQQLPACSRCQAQVPGMAFLEPYLESRGNQVFPVNFCHQCAVTMYRQCVEPSTCHEAGVPYELA